MFACTLGYTDALLHQQRVREPVLVDILGRQLLCILNTRVRVHEHVTMPHMRETRWVRDRVCVFRRANAWVYAKAGVHN